MFAVIYRAFIQLGFEWAYQDAWCECASYFIKCRGALGSCLHKTSEGMWLAYSRWPYKATRDASWLSENAPSDVLPGEIKKIIVKIQNCIDQTQMIYCIPTNFNREHLKCLN